MTPAAIFSNVVEAAKKHPDVDGIYIQSGTMTSVPILDRLEQEVGKAVVSTNSASIWGSFKAVGVQAGPGFGQLLSGR